VVVRAATSASSVSAEFTLAIDPHAPIRVTLDTRTQSFVSQQNSSRPAVDTIAVGDSVRWLEDPFDYDDHTIVPVGTPAFTGGGEIDYYLSTAFGVFPAAGTYKYVDSQHPTATGTVVVR
jgi:plastocyanin